LGQISVEASANKEDVFGVSIKDSFIESHLFFKLGLLVFVDKEQKDAGNMS